MNHLPNSTDGVYRRFLTTASAWNTTNPAPTFICPTNTTVNSTGNNDWFTVEATTENKGNGVLDYPIGLITADEIVAAGSGVNKSNDSYYLYKGHMYWALSLVAWVLRAVPMYVMSLPSVTYAVTLWLTLVRSLL